VLKNPGVYKILPPPPWEGERNQRPNRREREGDM